MDVAGILFDCDGVLVDSLEAVDAAWSAWSLRYGLDPAEVLPTIHGVRAVESIARLLPAADVASAELMLENLEVDLSGEVRAIPGAVDLLSSLPRGRWAIATSASRRLALARIAAAGIPMPDVLVTADDVPRGKPSPDPYLAAAAGLALDAASCVVFEDTLAGAAAGHAAGATVVGVRTTLTDTDFHPHHSVTDLTAVTVSRAGPNMTVELA